MKDRLSEYAGRRDETFTTDKPATQGRRYRLEGGELVPHREGQWVHVGDYGIKSWVLDAPMPGRDR